jgi:uncharacterized protein YcfJ
MTTTKRVIATRFVLLGAAVSALAAGGCNNAGEGALSGAAIGAGAGAIIGSIYGHAGTGAAIGAVAGGITGGVIGDQNYRNASDRYYYYDQPQRKPSGCRNDW